MYLLPCKIKSIIVLEITTYSTKSSNDALRLIASIFTKLLHYASTKMRKEDCIILEYFITEFILDMVPHMMISSMTYADDDYRDMTVTATVNTDKCSWDWLGWFFCLF